MLIEFSRSTTQQRCKLMVGNGSAVNYWNSKGRISEDIGNSGNDTNACQHPSANPDGPGNRLKCSKTVPNEDGGEPNDSTKTTRCLRVNIAGDSGNFAIQKIIHRWSKGWTKQKHEVCHGDEHLWIHEAIMFLPQGRHITASEWKHSQFIWQTNGNKFSGWTIKAATHA